MYPLKAMHMHHQNTGDVIEALQHERDELTQSQVVRYCVVLSSPIM